MIKSRIIAAGALALALVLASGCNVKNNGATTYSGTVPAPAGSESAAPAKNLKPVDKFDPVAPPQPVKGQTVKVNWHIEQRTMEISKGVTREVWTFNGSVPGPTVRVNVGDTVDVTLTNDTDQAHSLDMHAAMVSPDDNFKMIMPKQSFHWSYKANNPGVFVYHCGTMPMLMHIANGMYGMIIVDPATPREKMPEYVLMESEWWKSPTDMKAMENDQPDYYAFNGVSGQYLANPLPAKVGDHVRLYVGNIGPRFVSSFHVVGTQLDLAEPSGNPDSAMHHLQTSVIGSGDAAMFEVTLPQAGKYPFVDHDMAAFMKGAGGYLEAK